MKSERVYNVIDTHAHFGLDKNKQLERERKVNSIRGQRLLEDMGNLKASVGYEKALIDENNSLDSYINIMNENNISMAWIHQLSFEHDLGYEIISNEDIASAIEKYPDRLRGFASVNPYDKDIKGELDYIFNDLKLSGFKLNPNDYGGFVLNDREKLYPIYEKCCEYSVPVSIHTGITPGRIYRMKNNYPLLVDDVAVDFPELKIIVEHMGFPWSDLCFSMVQRHPNMYVTITAVANIMIHNNPNNFKMQLAKMIAMLGSEKILWGSDWTATPNIDEVIKFLMKVKIPFPMRKILGLRITKQDIKNILYENAITIIK